MALTPGKAGTFNPKIDFDSGSPFVFFDNNMELVNIPNERWGLNYNEVLIPLQIGGDAFLKQERPLEFTTTWKFEKALDPDLQQVTLELLKTALRGKTSASSTFPKDHFKYFYHDDGGSNKLFLEKCICTGMEIARSNDKFFKNGQEMFTVIQIGIRAMNPIWQTSGVAPSGDLTVDGSLTIECQSGQTVALVVNDGVNDTISIKCNGNIDIVGELSEELGSV